MATYKTVSENRSVSGSNYVVKRSILKEKNIVIKQNGSRAADECTLTVKGNYDIGINDTLSVLCDDVSVENLKAVWNFYYSLRDESGYNIDLQNVNNSDNVTTAPKYSVETSATSRYKGQKCLDCTSTQHKLLAIQNTTENNKVIDFNKGCDIFIHLRTPSSLSGEQVIFSRSSSSKGVEVG